MPPSDDPNTTASLAPASPRQQHASRARATSGCTSKLHHGQHGTLSARVSTCPATASTEGTCTHAHTIAHTQVRRHTYITTVPFQHTRKQETVNRRSCGIQLVRTGVDPYAKFSWLHVPSAAATFASARWGMQTRACAPARTVSRTTWHACTTTRVDPARTRAARRLQRGFRLCLPQGPHRLQRAIAGQRR